MSEKRAIEKITADQLVKKARSMLHREACPVHKEVLQRFFKTGPGEYGEGDVFIGLRMPQIRAVARDLLKDCELSKDVISEFYLELIKSSVHEERMLIMVMMSDEFGLADEVRQSRIYKLYCKITPWINNWDLVDVSCPKIVGSFLTNRSRSQLYNWVKSSNLWERRIAIVSTYTFIRNSDFADCLRLAEQLLDDREDLLHKATGWMLREVGKRSRKHLDKFLEKHVTVMPRTTLRYAIEKHAKEERTYWLNRVA